MATVYKPAMPFLASQLAPDPMKTKTALRNYRELLVRTLINTSDLESPHQPFYNDFLVKVLTCFLTFAVFKKKLKSWVIKLGSLLMTKSKAFKRSGVSPAFQTGLRFKKMFSYS